MTLFARVLTVTAFALGSANTSQAAEFTGSFTPGVTRPWIGPAFWSNPMEDWRLTNGRIETIRAGANRNVYILTHQLGEKPGTLAMSVRLGRLDAKTGPVSVGFRVGIRSELGDYRSALIYGSGLDAGLASNGGLFIGRRAGVKPNPGIQAAREVTLSLFAQPKGQQYSVRIEATSPDGVSLGKINANIPAARLVGSLALVNDFGTVGSKKKKKKQKQSKATPRPRHWFDDWKISGSKVVAHEKQAWGPILWAMHSLSRRVMKMTAQLPPIGTSDSQSVTLQLGGEGNWKDVATAKLHPLARTATFRIEKWDDTRDTPYRLVYSFRGSDGKTRDHYWTGTVRKNPVDQRSIVVAGFTGNTDTGFPNARIAKNVAIHDPDVLLFTGDQIYESVGGYGIHRGPVDVATVNYLRKWYLFGFAFGDLMRDRVTLCLPDDHDVYQGNIWGNGGNATNMANHNAGGYAMPAEWVNMIQRTQTSHHPDPFDATPIKQDISVYYGDMLYGRVSFAIIEDRKFKSGPKGTVATWPGRPDHVKDPKFDPKLLDKPGLKLLGDRQLKFLRSWSQDWRGADMKVVCSQTILCNLANYHGGNKEYVVADLDANGWPQAGRNRALREIRKGFAFMYAGDQHLPSIVHHGIDAQGDSCFSFCVPSIAAGYPRSWLPDKEGRPVMNRHLAGGLANTGDYSEGLGNLVRVYGIGNPAPKNRPGRLNTLHDKSSGYGIVRFDTQTQKITMECWRLLVDAGVATAKNQFPGWPKTIHFQENYGRDAVAHLPTIEVSGLTNPIVQVIDEADGKIVYTLRVKGLTFRPKVFRNGPHTIKVGSQEDGNMKTLKGVKPAKDGVLKVAF